MWHFVSERFPHDIRHKILTSIHIMSPSLISLSYVHQHQLLVRKEEVELRGKAPAMSFESE
jgi:hypothetical protein